MLPCRLSLPVSLLLLAGCVTETLRPERNVVRFLEFPEGVLLREIGTYHNTYFIVEVEPEAATRPLILPYPRQNEDGTEFYECEGHAFAYHNSRFHIGYSRYLPRRNSRIYIFKERDGNFEFRFHSQTIVVEADRKWIPSLFYYVESDRTELASRQYGSGRRIQRGSSTWQKETLRIGRARIEADTRHKAWLVNGKPHFPAADKPLLLKGVVSLGIR